jgi:hypothetical protein
MRLSVLLHLQRALEVELDAEELKAAHALFIRTRLKDRK